MSRDEPGIVLDVEQHQSRLPEQVHRPARDDDRAQNPDQGIERAQSERGAEAERRKREQRGRGVGQHVHIGRPQIVVAWWLVVSLSS